MKGAKFEIELVNDDAGVPSADQQHKWVELWEILMQKTENAAGKENDKKRCSTQLDLDKKCANHFYMNFAVVKVGITKKRKVSQDIIALFP